MPRLTRLKEIGEYIYLTFRIRQVLLISIVALAVIPGMFIFNLPREVRLVYAYVFVAIFYISAVSLTNFFSVPIVQLIGLGLYGRKSVTREYSTPEIKELAKKMGISKAVKVYITNNRLIRGPFTNGFTGKVYLTEAWVKRFPHKEVMATLAHEFSHVKNGRRFSLEIAVVMAGVMLVTAILALHSIPVIVDIAGFAMMILMMSFLARNNEIRADVEAARAVGPEALISVFEQLKADSKKDDGSETHPSLRERIARLMKMLEEDKS